MSGTEPESDRLSVPGAGPDTSHRHDFGAAGRELVAIVHADVIGYSRLIALDDAGTIERLTRLRRVLIDPELSRHGGRIVQTGGDSLLVIFRSTLRSITWAVAVQRQMPNEDSAFPKDQQIRFRMGIEIGDVISEGSDLHGEGVNIAARLQAVCPPGAVCVSRSVYDQVRARIDMPVHELGALELKNIGRLIEAYVICADPESGSAAVLTGAARQASAYRPSVAVMPFRMFDPDPEKAYFGDCMVEDIIGSLSALQDLRVISRNSTASYRGADLDLRQLSRDLGVRYVLSGGVRRDPSRLRITAELADAENGQVLWARPYDATADDLFQIQDKIVAQIVGTIAPRVREAELQRAMRKRPESMDAYDLVLQAMQLLYRLDPNDFARAHELLLQAIRKDENYSAAYALLSQWHLLRIGQGWSPDRRVDEQEGLRRAQAAVDRDQRSAHALAQLGHWKSLVLRDYESALALFERALLASPSHAWAWGLSAPTFSYIGKPTEAIARAEHAMALSPNDPLTFWYQTTLCIAHYTLGQYEEAASWGRRSMLESPRYTACARHTAAALAALGRLQEASEVARRLMEVDPSFRVSERVAQYAYASAELLERLRMHLLAAGLPT